MKGIIAYNKKDDIINNSSSGGVFYELANYIIMKDGIVFGASFDESGMVNHIGIDNSEEISLLQGSKYVESSLENTLIEMKEAAEQGRDVLFCGTPCQIKAVSHFIETNSLDREKILLVDFICHGTPEKKYWKDYLNYLTKKNGKLVGEINFRDKRNGWKNYGLSIEFSEKKYYKSHYVDEYMFYFLNDYLLKDACFNCNFRSQSKKASDITLGDAWQMASNKKGCSLVSVNTEYGEKVFNSISEKMSIISSSEIEDVNNISGTLDKKKTFINDYEQYGFSKQLKKKYMSGKRYYINVLKSVYSRFFKR